MNENLIELVDLIPDDKLDWSPNAGEWSFQLILTHIILARYHGPIMTAYDAARMPTVPLATKTKDGIKEQLRTSWGMLDNFLAEPDKLDATYEPMGGGPLNYYTGEPDSYDGHYVAYHRFAHDLHHRSTIIGYLGELGVPLDGRRIRPL